MPESAKTLSILSEIVRNKQREVAERQALRPLKNLRACLGEIAPLSGFPFEAALRQPKVMHLITEIKASSPSKGVLQAEVDLDGLLAIYNDYGSAISVLTDATYFGGSLQRLSEVSMQSPHPLLCKDFILSEYQVLEARLAGASAVLLIVKILEPTVLQALYDEICALGMTPVVEVQNEAELDAALRIGADVLLINNRNLDTFEVSLNTTHQLAESLRARLKAGTLSLDLMQRLLLISASGIATRADIETLLPDAHIFLIGSSLMALPISELPQKLTELCGK